MDQMKVPSGWACPLCGDALVPDPGVLTCGSKHSFDRSKEGYVNFMTGKARPGLKGDTPAMFAARRAFLGAGHYAPLARRVTEAVAVDRPQTVYDAGCGEGYYARMVRAARPDACVLATDIARDGVRMAAKADASTSFAVCDTTARLPLPSGSVDRVINVFAPRNADEFARILKAHGELIVVIPGENHLAQLRDRFRMLGMQPDKAAGVRRYFEHWADLGVEAVAYDIGLDATAASQLLAMTPSAWFRQDEPAPSFAGEMTVTASFMVMRFGPPVSVGARQGT